MLPNTHLYIFFGIVYFVCKMQTNEMSAGNPSQTSRTAQLVKTADYYDDVLGDYNYFDNLLHLAVVGNYRYSSGCRQCPLGSNLTIECSIGSYQSDSPIASSTLLRLLQNNKFVAEGSAKSTLRYTFGAEGEIHEYARRDSFKCLALADNGSQLADATEVTCYGSVPRLPDTDCEILLFINRSTSEQRIDVRCSITPNDDQIARETHLAFDSSITLWDAPCNASAARPKENSECPKESHRRGTCEWHVSLALSFVCVNVSGINALGRLSQLRPVRLQERLRLGDPLPVPNASVVSSPSSWLNRTLLVQWSQPSIAVGPLSLPLRELGIPPVFQFTIRVRCVRAIFPVFFACSHFHEYNSSVYNMSRVELELPAGVYRVELVARIPPNARFSPPAVLEEVVVDPTAFFWAIFIAALLLVIVVSIAIIGIIVCFSRHKIYLRRMPLGLPCETSLELLQYNPESTSSGYVPSQLLEPYQSIQNYADYEVQTVSLVVDYIEPGQEHQAPNEHINQLSGYASDSITHKS